MTSAASRDAARDRAARMRERDRLERLPDVHMLNACIAAGLAQFLGVQFHSDPALIQQSPGARLLFSCIEQALLASDIDARHPITKSRLRKRLGIPGATVRRPAL